MHTVGRECFLSQGAEKAQEKATSQLEMNNTRKAAWRSLGMGSLGMVSLQQDGQECYLCLAAQNGQERGAFHIRTGEMRGWEMLIWSAVFEISVCHRLSSGRRLSILPSKGGSVRMYMWQSA